MLRRIRELIALGAPKRRRRGLLGRRLGRAGFTFMEMCIVIQIIAFMATMVLQNYYKSKKAAEVAVCVENLKNIQTALTSYFAMENEFPATLNSIWLQFYNGRVIGDFSYIGGATWNNQGGWNFFPSNSVDIKFNGITSQQYAIKSNQSLLPYALYIYGDAATSAKVVH